MHGATETGRELLTPRSVTWGGLVANVLLAVGKVLAGLLCHSQAILADGFHSLSDLVTDVAVLAGLRMSERPADGTHPYGHRRISTLVAMCVGAALLAAAGCIAVDAVVSIPRPHVPITSLWPLAMALATIPVKEGLFHLTRFVGRRAGDVSLTANAWHHRSDAFSSIAAAAGLTVVAVGGQKWAFVDHLTALVLSAFLAAAALRIIRVSAAELIDRAPHAATVSAIERAVAGTDGVRDYHAVRARQLGGKVSVDIHVLVHPGLTVKEGHDIATVVEESVRAAEPNVIEIVVHVEPWEADAANAPETPSTSDSRAGHFSDRQ